MLFKNLIIGLKGEMPAKVKISCLMLLERINIKKSKNNFFKYYFSQYTTQVQYLACIQKNTLRNDLVFIKKLYFSNSSIN